MSLRDFPLDVWEILLNKLLARHCARLVATGDTLVKHALMHTRRELDLFFHDGEAVIQGRKNLMSSALVKDVLVQYARQLTIDTADFSQLTSPLPALTSLTARQSAFAYKTFLANLKTNATVVDEDGLVTTRLDLAKLTPNLKHLDFALFEFGVVLPETLESLAFTFDACDRPLRQIENMGSLVHLTTMVIDAAQGNVFFKDTTWPPNLTSLTTDLSTEGAMSITALPASLRILNVINASKAPLPTGLFSRLSLTELSIRDRFADDCSRLTVVPSTLTALTLDTLCTVDAEFMGGGFNEETVLQLGYTLGYEVDRSNATDIVRSLGCHLEHKLANVLAALPASLTDITINAVPSSTVDAEEMNRCLHLLFPRMQLRALDQLATSLAKCTRSVEIAIFSSVVGELKTRGPQGELCAQKATFLFELLQNRVEKDVDVMRRIVAKAEMPRREIVSVINTFWSIAGLSAMDNFYCDDTKLIASFVEKNLTMSIEQVQCCVLPTEMTEKLVGITTVGFSSGNMDLLLSVSLNALTRLCVNHGAQSYDNLIGCIDAICKYRANLPWLETIVMDVPPGLADDCRAVIDKRMADDLCFYPTGVSGEYRFRVAPPTDKSTPGALFDLLKFMECA